MTPEKMVEMVNEALTALNYDLTNVPTDDHVTRFNTLWKANMAGFKALIAIKRELEKETA